MMNRFLTASVATLAAAGALASAAPSLALPVGVHGSGRPGWGLHGSGDHGWGDRDHDWGRDHGWGWGGRGWGYGGWRPGYGYGYGYGWGGWPYAAAVGAAIGGAYAYGYAPYGYYGSGPCVAHRRVWDPYYGRYIVRPFRYAC